MEAKSAMLARRWSMYYKGILGTLGAVIAPLSLFAAYHAAQLSLSQINLDILELERQRQSYVTYNYAGSNKSASQSRYVDVVDESSYISLPVWSWFGIDKGPKYWAKIAHTAGPTPRALAIELLSRLHDMPDSVYYSAGLSCDNQTLIDLARIKRTDVRYFREPRKCFNESEHLSKQLYQYLRSLPTGIDKCAKDYVDVLLGRTPPLQGCTDDLQDEDIDFDTEIHKPRKADLCPPAQSLAHLTESSLDVIWHHTMQGDQRCKFIYRDHGLQLLTRVWYVFKSDEEMMSKLANILVNLTQDQGSHALLASGGFLHMLAMWMKSLNPKLKCSAAAVLTNLSNESVKFQSGVYPFHPVYKSSAQPKVDVVFVHGVKGRAFLTWRQHESMQGKDDYTTCWPKNWLADEFGTSVRSLGVDYTSNATYWENQCPYNSDKLSIEAQATALIDKLSECRLGGDNRKIVWVGHSLGGLIIKKMLSLAEENCQYKEMLDNTESIIFLGVPHRGSPLAQFSLKTSYISSPTIQLKEIADVSKLSELNQQFKKLVNKQKIVCKNFMEGSKTYTPAKFKLHLVPPEYAELDFGENVLLEEENHITISKPKSPDSKLFKALTRTIRDVIDKQHAA